MGDSVTYGFGVGCKESFPEQLQDILNSKLSSYKFEVINAGVLGYTSYQGLKYFQRDIIKYQPDLITVCFGINDGTPAVYFEDRKKRCCHSGY